MTEDWCTVCETLMPVLQEGVEEDLWSNEWWVILFDCGHEIALPR